MGIGRTFQIPRPFKRLSIIENAALAGYFGNNKEISKSEAWLNAEEALSLVGLSSVANDEIATLGAAGLKKIRISKSFSNKA
jgi:branched-chain amino acid transport system ATP-binding protein